MLMVIIGRVEIVSNATCRAAMWPYQSEERVTCER